MLGENSGNHVLPVFLDETQVGYQSNAANQLQLFRNVQAGCGVNHVSSFGNEHISSMIRSNKRSREAEDMSKPRKLQISLNYNSCQEEADRAENIPDPNSVSTGLRIYCDDDERNSSITSASGSITLAPSMILSFGDNIRTELDRQQEELDRYIELQKDKLAKEVRGMKKRHMASVLSAIEKGVSKKLREKDVEIESINQRNRELEERIKKVSIEAQNWHYRAKYNEQVVNVLRNNLQQAISQGVEHTKEGFGDSEIDDAASYIDPNNNFLSVPGTFMISASKTQHGMEKNLTCRGCRAKEVSMLLMPCRHLCLCDECDIFINVCPVCQSVKTTSALVYMS